MSEVRIPDEVWSVSLPQNQGKKLTKIELFSAKQWREYALRIKDRNRFSPKIPGLPAARREYYSTRYRVRVDGRFILGPRKTFITFTKQEIFDRYLNGREDEMPETEVYPCQQEVV